MDKEEKTDNELPHMPQCCGRQACACTTLQKIPSAIVRYMWYTRTCTCHQKFSINVGNEQYQNWKSEIFNLVMRNIRIGKKEIFNLVIRNIQIGNHRFADDKYANWKLVTQKIQFGNGKSANWKSVMRNFQIGNLKKLKSVVDMALPGPDLVVNFVVAKLVH